MHTLAVRAALGCLPVFLVSGSVEGAGFYLTDIGTRGMGRAGAFVAAPDNVLAIHYNPAGLALLRGLHTETSLTFVFTDVRFDRRCPCVDPTDPDAAALDTTLERQFLDNPAEANTTLLIPFIGAAYGFDFWDFTVALAAWGPNSGRFEYGTLPDPSRPRFERDAPFFPGRYSGLQVQTIEANFALGFALSPVEGLRVGASAMVFQSGNDQTLHLWANSNLLGAEGPEDVNLDVPVRLDFRENFGLNWSIGVSYDLVPGLSIGSSFRGKRSIRTDGTITVGLPPAIGGGDPPLVTVSGRNVEVEVNTAPLWRAGVQFRHPGWLTAEAAFVWEHWSVHERVVVRGQDVRFSILGDAMELAPIVADRRWEDTWSLRLGGEVHVFEPWLSGRFGYFYEPSAIPPDRVDASRVDLDKHGVSLGLATEMYGAKLEVSGMYVGLKGEDVRDSQQRQLGPLPARELLTTVGNGRYGGEYFLLSVALSFSLDGLLDALAPPVPNLAGGG